MINLFLSGNNIFVWNPEDIITLRKEYRIVGSLIGTCPKKKLHSQKNWLPLLLMKEEAKLLIDKGIAQLVRSPEKITDPALVESFYAQRDKLCEEQIILMKDKRKRQIIEKADEIYEGKKRKYMQLLKGEAQKKSAEVSSQDKNPSPMEIDDSNDKNKDIGREVNENEQVNSKSENVKTIEEKDEEKINDDIPSQITQDASDNKKSELSDNNLSPEDNQEKASSVTLKDHGCLSKDDNCDFLSKEAVIEAELAKIPDVDKELCMVQLFCECPFKNTTDIVNLEYPVSEMEKLRYEVFKDLWEKSYYITGGMKFGGDFLVYKGDPIKYHAIYIVICIPRSRKMDGIDIIIHGRLGKQVKKFAVFVQMTNGTLHYCNATFAGDIK